MDHSGTLNAADIELECLEIIESYYKKAKFVFIRDKDVYYEYLTQLKYFVSHIVDAMVR